MTKNYVKDAIRASLIKRINGVICDRDCLVCSIICDKKIAELELKILNKNKDVK
jgi:hypothetical protein